MAFSVEVSPGAKLDLSSAFDWYREKSSKAGNAFRAEVLGVFDLLSEDPGRWAVWDGDIRRFVMKRYPYTVYFEIDEAIVRILAVGHHRRAPRYWSGG
ncbi:MAG TPA: type II toxin-antitoxin system RelE/ParE family toxin [Ideonella sp.]|nr:type II toxin-antitoxin system RelE/ParE family toxin [Ideonella sp.]